MTHKVKITTVAAGNGKFRGVYQVSSNGHSFAARTTYGMYPTEEAATVGAQLEADIAIAHGIFMPTTDDMHRQNFVRSQERRSNAEKIKEIEIRVRIRKAVKKHLLRLAKSI
jgi:hypothetical protein